MHDTAAPHALTSEHMVLLDSDAAQPPHGCIASVLHGGAVSRTEGSRGHHVSQRYVAASSAKRSVPLDAKD
jgi:hypothetical protein